MLDWREGGGGLQSIQHHVWHRAGAHGPLDITSILIASSSVQYQLSQEFLSHCYSSNTPYKPGIGSTEDTMMNQNGWSPFLSGSQSSKEWKAKGSRIWSGPAQWANEHCSHVGPHTLRPLCLIWCAVAILKFFKISEQWTVYFHFVRQAH